MKHISLSPLHPGSEVRLACWFWLERLWRRRWDSSSQSACHVNEKDEYKDSFNDIEYFDERQRDKTKIQIPAVERRTYRAREQRKNGCSVPDKVLEYRVGPASKGF